jgi:hypothetical protein
MNGQAMVGGLGGDNPMALMGGGMAMPNHVLVAGAAQRGKLGRGVTDPAAYAHKLFIGQIPFEVGCGPPREGPLMPSCSSGRYP